MDLIKTTEKYREKFVFPSKWKTKGYVAGMPHKVLFARDLSPSAKLIYWLIKANCFDRDNCILSLRHIQKEIGFSRPTAISSLNKLKELKYIHIQGKKGQINKIFLLVK